MKIDSLKNISTPNFKAIKVAETRNVITDLFTEVDLYKIYKGDRLFLQKLAELTDYTKLAAHLSEFQQKRWQNIFNYCITKAFLKDNESYVAVSDARVCGIMTYSFEQNNVIKLDGICSIPFDNNKKVKQLRKSMFYQLFTDAKNADVKGISLDAVIDGPFEVVPMYEELGFKKNMNISKYVSMFCNKHKILYQLKELPFFVKYKQFNDENHTNLIQFLI